MGIHEDSGEMNFGSFLQPKSLQLKLDQIISQVQEIKITQTLHSESINRFSEKQASMGESIFKIQESLSESKVDEKVGTKVLALLETNLKSVETTLKSFETTLREIMVDLTVKGAAVAQKAELLKSSSRHTFTSSARHFERISKFLLSDNCRRKLPRLFS